MYVYMELLKKTYGNIEDRRTDNFNKKELFPKDRHPHSANYYKDEWGFVEDTFLRENIAYQMQYLEFLIHLYNDYQIYLTTESLLCKDIITLVGGIIEAVLFDLVQFKRKESGMEISDRNDFTTLLGAAYHDFHLIDRDAWHFFHNLRKTRNFVHLKAADFREHVAYTTEDANECLGKLEEFRLNISQCLEKK